MIVCVEAQDLSGNVFKDPPVGIHLIQDTNVADACAAVVNYPDLYAAEKQLKETLDPTKYIVGMGGHHIFVCHKSIESPTGWKIRFAMLVDTNDADAYHPGLADFA